MKNVWLKNLQTWLLKQEVKRAGNFFIGGYQNFMVRMNDRFLEPWQVAKINQWLKDGLIIQSGTQAVTSPTTGVTYHTQLYIWKKDD